jgi:hypothetical protein
MDLVMASFTNYKRFAVSGCHNSFPSVCYPCFDFAPNVFQPPDVMYLQVIADFLTHFTLVMLESQR